MECRSYVTVLFLCVIISVVNLQNEENDCPEFNPNHCKESPIYENQDIYGCNSDYDCGNERKCCKDCRYTYRICTEVAVKEYLSDHEEYLKNKYCPKVKPCFIPLKYDLRYRCGSDEVCPYGYKCCRTDCYIHKVCVPPVDKEGNEVAPPPTTTTATTAQTETIPTVVSTSTKLTETTLMVFLTPGTTSEGGESGSSGDGHPDDDKDKKRSENDEAVTKSSTTISSGTMVSPVLTIDTAETATKVQEISRATSRFSGSSSGFTNSDDGDDDGDEIGSGNDNEIETQAPTKTTSLPETTAGTLLESSTTKRKETETTKHLEITKFSETTEFSDSTKESTEFAGSGDDYSGSGDDDKVETLQPITSPQLPSTLSTDLEFIEENSTSTESQKTTITAIATVPTVKSTKMLQTTTANNTEEFGSGDGLTDDEDAVKTTQSIKSTTVLTTISELQGKRNISSGFEGLTTASSTVPYIEGSGDSDNDNLFTSIFSPHADDESLTSSLTNSTIKQLSTTSVTTESDFRFYDTENSTASFTTTQKDLNLNESSTLNFPSTDVQGSGVSDDEDFIFSPTFIIAETTKQLPTKPSSPDIPTTGDFDYGDETSAVTTTIKQTSESQEVTSAVVYPETQQILTSDSKVATTQQTHAATLRPGTPTTGDFDYEDETNTSTITTTERKSLEIENDTASTINLDIQETLSLSTNEDEGSGLFDDEDFSSSSIITPGGKTSTNAATATTTVQTSAFTVQELQQTIAPSSRNSSFADSEDGSGFSDDEDLAFTFKNETKINSFSTVSPEDKSDLPNQTFRGTTGDDFIYEKNTTTINSRTQTQASELDLLPDIVEDISIFRNGKILPNDDTSTSIKKDVQEKPNITISVSNLAPDSLSTSSPALPKQLNDLLIPNLGETTDSVEEGSAYDPYYISDDDDDHDDGDDVDEDIRNNFNLS